MRAANRSPTGIAAIKLSAVVRSRGWSCLICGPVRVLSGIPVPEIRVVPASPKSAMLRMGIKVTLHPFQGWACNRIGCKWDRAETGYLRGGRQKEEQQRVKPNPSVGSRRSWRVVFYRAFSPEAVGRLRCGSFRWCAVDQAIRRLLVRMR